MATSLEIFRDIATEFSGTGDDVVSRYLEYAGDWVSVTEWGTRRVYGAAYLAAHMMKTAGINDDGSTGAAGPVTQKVTGPLSISFAQVQGVSDTSKLALARTSYGQEFMRLQRATCGGPRVIS